jgi:hypothetical protein
MSPTGATKQAICPGFIVYVGEVLGMFRIGWDS